ncbi:hypothetical protein FIBSPDRAFT_37916 [Athelia psychrophila]|uniref:Uncharacterized protein n=1 Tax=Athelia psychrophila TaxID=1759441 RepID=A0A166FQC4_9AGAM|nr:hypothetical protein FIBSPDRAFT_37916 [Fibularhizoctonia sp. CBS 109695]
MHVKHFVWRVPSPLQTSPTLGTTHYLSTYGASNIEGTQVHLCDRAGRWSTTLRSMVFFIDRSGALHHAASGLAVDIVDDVPILRRNRPVSSCPNPWSRPLPEFSALGLRKTLCWPCAPRKIFISIQSLIFHHGSRRP